MVFKNKTSQFSQLGKLIDLLEYIIRNRERNLNKYQKTQNPSQFFINKERELIEDLKSILGGFSKLNFLNYLA